MKLEPLATYRPRDFALLTPGGRTLTVETTWGAQTFRGTRDVTNALAKLADFTCYVSVGLERMKHVTPATQWVLRTWRGKGVRMTHTPTGTTVTSLRGTLEGSPDPFADLARVIRWLRQFGIAPGPVSGMSWKLLRASLGRRYSVGFDPQISERAFFGGRQELKKGAAGSTVRGAVSWDTKAAYPSAMAARPIALGLREVSRGTQLDPSRAGLAEAIVHVPRDLTHPPLPVRLGPATIQFQWGELRGVWPWVELDAARQLGCDVDVITAWAPSREADLFGPWWDLAREGRDLGGAAARLAKALANTTWGQFAMRGNDRSEVSWSDDSGKLPYELALPDRHLPHVWALHVAAEVTSRVRVATLLQGVYPTGGAPLHIDTDGVIIAPGATPPANIGDDFGQFRVKERMKVVELRAPQFYRFQRDGDDSWKYVASGMTPDMARLTFEKTKLASDISWLTLDDHCLPPATTNDRARIARLMAEAKMLGAA